MINVARIYKKLRQQAAAKHPIAAAFSLHVKSSVHDSERHFAQSGNGGTYVAPEISQLKESKIKAILAHEIAHLLVEAEAVQLPPANPTYDQLERHVDKIAEQTFGIPIYYDEKGIEDCVFHPAFKRPRPAGLR